MRAGMHACAREHIACCVSCMAAQRANKACLLPGNCAPQLQLDADPQGKLLSAYAGAIPPL